MPSYAQATRPLTIRTPLDPDTFIVLALEGREAVSELYRFEVDVLTNECDLEFDKLLGEKATVSLSGEDGNARYFSGIVCAVEQGETLSFNMDGRSEERIHYRLSIVPALWRLSRRRNNRIFQRKTVKQILENVLAECDAQFGQINEQIERDYCVQYRETDLNFALRLMEEEGLYFYFTHSESGHEMVIAESRATSPDLSGPFLFEPRSAQMGGNQRIFQWRKTQEIRSGKCHLRDYCFEMPDTQLKDSSEIQETIEAGEVTHQLTAGRAKDLEIYDWPGGYASRLDGLNKTGGEQSSELAKIFDEGRRTVATRMQEEAAAAVTIAGKGNVGRFAAGCLFTLGRHFADDGQYLITSVTHRSRQPVGAADRTSEAFHYGNDFTCIPAAIPFRPPRVTAVPVAHGTQTATVVGPTNQEIFTDKYGRVKVQFHWDREGTKDLNSSCWLRVASVWAGKNWGAIHIPRVGQEVVVAFEEGDPNQPIIIGSVYNASNMPPYALPDDKTQSGIKSRSTPQASGYNELRFEDKADHEQIVVHAQKDLLATIENDETRKVGRDRTTAVTRHDKLTIEQGNQTTKISLGKSETEAMQSIELKVGQSSIKLDQAGVTIKGLTIKIEGTIQVQMKGMVTQINGDAVLTAKGGVVMIN